MNKHRAETIAAIFDQLADSYETYRLANWYQSQAACVWPWLSLKPGDKVLDIGCATGWLLRQLAVRYPQASGIGIDLSPRMIEQANGLVLSENIKNLIFVHMDWELDEWYDDDPAHQFALIICANTLHYFDTPALALRKMRACLKPAGKLLMLERDKNKSALTFLWDLVHRLLIKDEVRFYSSEQLLAYLKQAGFARIRTRGRIKKLFWKNKMYTSMVWLEARNP